MANDHITIQQTASRPEFSAASVGGQMFLRARLIDSILFWLITPISTALVILTIIVTPEEKWRDGDFWIILLFGIMGPLFCCLHCWTQHVKIEGDVLVYSNLFNSLRKKTLRISRISKMQISSGNSKEKTKGLFLLCIYDNDKYAQNPLAIDLLSFNQKQRQSLVKSIYSLNADICIDKQTERIIQGKNVEMKVELPASKLLRKK